MLQAFEQASTTTRQTSGQSFSQVGIKRLKHLQDEIESLVAVAHACGVKDLSMREIQARFEDAFGQRIEMSTVSSRINSLVTAKRLTRDGEPRPCAITGRNILPVRVSNSIVSKG